MASNAPHIVELDRRAVELSMQILKQARPCDLARPTPCAGWSLSQLLEHMTAQHYVFAAASRGLGGNPRAWLPPPAADGQAAAYDEAARYVLDCFADPATLRRSFVLHDINPALAFPADEAISFHFVDYVVHGWDVARALDVPFEVSDEVAEAALLVARRVPDGPRRLSPDAQFRPGVPVAAGSSAIEETVAALGRPPAWQAHPAPDGLAG
ncbi:MAG TPA: TIGR03086 family metal-binding protein [Streptosporangiaceae bacterium]|jgi:uncharacterized protein (TIGR03086 family)